MSSTNLDTLVPEAKKWYAQVLKAHPELSEAGRVLLLEAARERARIAEAEAALANDGTFVEGLHGVKVHPAVSVAKNARATLLRILIALNLQEE